MNKQSLFEENGIGLFPMDAVADSEKLFGHPELLSFVRRPLNGAPKPCAVSDLKERTFEDPGKQVGINSEQNFVFRVLESGETIGVLRFEANITAHQTAWVKLLMNGEEVFSTYAREVLRLVLRFGFLKLNLNRICVEIPAFKEPEIALYEEAGFLRETQRRQAVFYNGSHYDDLLYGILRTEWLKLQQEVAV